MSHPYCLRLANRYRDGIMRISQKVCTPSKPAPCWRATTMRGLFASAILPRKKICPEKFLELILLELKYARVVDSVRGARGGYRLRRPPDQIF